MQNGEWVPISKYFGYALPKDRPFTDLEAMYSLQLDYEKNNSVTVLGYAGRWKWSRTKIDKFLSDHEVIISYNGEVLNLRKRRGFIDICPEKKRHKKEHKENNKGTIKGNKRFIDSRWIDNSKNNKKTIKGHKKSNEKSTTINPNIILNPNNQINNKPQNEFAENDFYLTKRKRMLNGKRLESFMRFWNIFNYKKGKAESADAWLDIPELTNNLVNKICEAARIESSKRPGLVSQGRVPKMAQGWITAKRWEDEDYTPSDEKKQNDNYPIETEDQIKKRESEENEQFKIMSSKQRVNFLVKGNLFSMISQIKESINQNELDTLNQSLLKIAGENWELESCALSIGAKITEYYQKL